MKTKSVVLSALCAMAAGCASTSTLSPADRIELTKSNSVRLLLYVDGESHNAFNVAPANVDFHVAQGEENGKPFIAVCSRQTKITASRIARDTCRSTNATVGMPWVEQDVRAYEYIAALALTRHLNAGGTIDFNKKLLKLDVGKDLLEQDVLMLID